MKFNLSKKIFLLTLFLTAALQLSVYSAAYKVKQIHNSPNYVNTSNIEDGQIAWSEKGADGNDSEIFLYNGKDKLQITNNNYDDSVFAISNGTIFWTAYPNGSAGNSWNELFCYKNNQIIQLTNTLTYKSSYKADNGQVVWSQAVGNLYHIFLYDGVNIRQITNDNRKNYSPDIHNGGIAWYSFDPSDSTYHINYYNGTETIELAGGLISLSSPQIHNGKVVWTAYTPPNESSTSEIYLYDGNSVQQITNNNTRESSPAINDRIIAWLVQTGQGSGELHVYENGNITMLTDQFESLKTPMLLPETVAWYERNPNEVYIYSNGEITQLTTDDGDVFYNTLTGIGDNAVAWIESETGQSHSNTIFIASPTLPIPGAIEAENYDYGLEGITYHDSDPANNGGGYRNGGVDLQPSSGGGYNLGWTEAGEWLDYTVNVRLNGYYKIGLVASSPNGDGSFHLELDGNVLTGSLDIPVTGGWQVWASFDTENVFLSEGFHTIRVVIDASGFNLDRINVSKIQDVDLLPAPIHFSGPLGVGKEMLLSSGVTNLGTSATGIFNVKWFINDEMAGYGSHESVDPQSTNWTGNSKLLWTPQAPGTYNITFSVDCDNHVAEANEANNSGTMILNVPFNHSIPGIVEAENYMFNAAAYYDTDLGNNGNATYRNDDVDMEVCSQGGYNISYIANGEWLKYEIPSVATGRYDIILDIASADSTSYKAITLVLAGKTLGTVYPYNTGNWQNWQQVALRGVNISGGPNQVLHLQFAGEGFNVDKINFIAVDSNMVKNANFANGLTDWSVYINEQANAKIQANNGYAGITIYDGNYESWWVQLSQNGMELEAGKTYELSFNVCASGHILSGEMDVLVEEDGGDYTSYMNSQTVYFGPNWTPFSFTFTMQEPTDTNGRITFNMGNFTSGWGSTYINIDNVKLALK